MVAVVVAVAASALLAVTVRATPLNQNMLHRRESGKAGISWPVQERSAAPVQQLFVAGSSLTWWYDWNKNHDTTLFPDDPVKVDVEAEFVPMFFDGSFLGNADPLDPGYKAVMGFNEPGKCSLIQECSVLRFADLHGVADVSNPTSPSDAAAKWKELVTEVRAQNPEVELWSPAVSANKQWLVDFFAAICPAGLAGCEFAPKYLSVHAYGTNVDGFKKQITAYHDQFGLDIVVSEFACHAFGPDGTSPAVTPEQASQYMRDTTTWLDATPWVHKYAWFGAVRNAAWLYAVHPSNRLLNVDGSLTPLGQQYVAGGQ